VRLMLCGHVHGGQIRVPLVGSIFVPSVYGRRFDMGVFGGGGLVAAIGRGLSGKEPLRFRCRPQVVRLTLTATAGVRAAGTITYSAITGRTAGVSRPVVDPGASTNDRPADTGRSPGSYLETVCP